MKSQREQASDFVHVTEAVSRARGLADVNPILLGRPRRTVAEIASILLARWRYGVPYAVIAEMLGYADHTWPSRIYQANQSVPSADIADALEAATRLLDAV